jgi:hypothetical protein
MPDFLKSVLRFAIGVGIAAVVIEVRAAFEAAGQ